MILAERDVVTHAGLLRTVKELVAPGRGILAIDESVATITKRFTALGIESTADSRRAYRQTLLTGPGIREFVSGAILYDETIRQTADGGAPFPVAMREVGLLCGIKVDTGAKPLAGFPDETVTEGLDGLRERIAEYVELGARFAKWRAVVTVDSLLPSRTALAINAQALGRYAALCQEGGLVPIVEPEVLMDGEHGMDRCEEVTTATLRLVFAELSDQGVDLEGMILKPNMVVAGKGCDRQPGVDEVAEATLRCLRRSVPAAVPGIAFLSGGQGAELATAHLNAMNVRGPHPWQLTFSYGRALQDPCLAAWAGDPASVPAAQAALRHRAECNAAAARGTYDDAMEKR
ncbi:MAG: fructose-bisphosphate aldolase class I [Candidatus Dormibacteria bacterium]